MYANPVALLPDVAPDACPSAAECPPRILHLYQTLYQTYTPLLQNATRRYNSIEIKNTFIFEYIFTSGSILQQRGVRLVQRLV